MGLAGSLTTRSGVASAGSVVELVEHAQTSALSAITPNLRIMIVDPPVLVGRDLRDRDARLQSRTSDPLAVRPWT